MKKQSCALITLRHPRACAGDLQVHGCRKEQVGKVHTVTKYVNM